jgi:hypothetical protein
MQPQELAPVLAPFYRNKGPAERFDHAERIVDWALALCRELGDDAHEVNREELTTLCYLILLADKVTRDLAMRGAVEAHLVAAGWSGLMIRQLWRSVENLPNKPKTLTEKLAADAWTLGELGMLGFARKLQICAARGETLAQAVSALQQDQNRRLHTRAGQRLGNERKNELRALVQQLAQAIVR